MRISRFRERLRCKSLLLITQGAKPVILLLRTLQATQIIIIVSKKRRGVFSCYLSPHTEVRDPSSEFKWQPQSYVQTNEVGTSWAGGFGFRVAFAVWSLPVTWLTVPQMCPARPWFIWKCQVLARNEVTSLLRYEQRLEEEGNGKGPTPTVSPIASPDNVKGINCHYAGKTTLQKCSTRVKPRTHCGKFWAPRFKTA